MRPSSRSAGLNKVAKIHRTRNSELDLDPILGVQGARHRHDRCSRSTPSTTMPHDPWHHHGHHLTTVITPSQPPAEHRHRLHREARRSRRPEGEHVVPLGDRRIWRQDPADEGHPQSAGDTTNSCCRACTGISKGGPGRLGRGRGTSEPGHLHRSQARLRQDRRGFEKCFFTRTRDGRPTPIRSARSRNLTLHPRANPLLDAAELQLPERDRSSSRRCPA